MGARGGGLVGVRSIRQCNLDVCEITSLLDQPPQALHCRKLNSAPDPHTRNDTWHIHCEAKIFQLAPEVLLIHSGEALALNVVRDAAKLGIHTAAPGMVRQRASTAFLQL